MPTNADAWWNDALEELRVARLLKESGEARQAYHHAGQAIEFALKAIYLRRHNLQALPEELKIHDLKKIAARARLARDLDVLGRENKSRYANWLTVRDWDSNARFPGNRQPTKVVTDLYLAVCHKGDGIWEWLESIYHQS